MSDKKLKKIAAKQASATTPAINVTIQEVALLGLAGLQRDERPYVNLRYYWPDHQCFSSWDAAKLKAFSQFCRKLSQVKWQDIYKTSGSPGNKVGFGYTPHKNIDVLPANPDMPSFSPDLTWFELRVDQESRVHGFRAKDAFFLVFLDRDHEIYKD
jgi:hypothetical protein